MAVSLTETKIGAFCEQLASRKPTPGGGSAAALAGALAAALGQMVANYTLGKKKYAEVQPRVKEIAERLGRARAMLERLIDEDASAYGVLNEAFALDKSDPQRAAAVEQAARFAGSVPLETAALCGSVHADAKVLGEIGNRLLRSDADAAAALAEAGLRAAAANVRANLPLMGVEPAAEIGRQLESLLAGLERAT
jgi:formiminotetrahydrofolate cyclodeaminase